jgi:hypothetical protein
VLTVGVLGLACAGVVLILTEAPAARTCLLGAAVGGLVTALPLWLPAGVVLAAAALLLGGPSATSAPANGA